MELGSVASSPFLPGIMEFAIGLLMALPRRRQRHAGLPWVGAILMCVGLVDVIIVMLYDQQSVGRAEELVAIAVVAAGTAASARFHRVVLHRPVAPPPAQALVAATWVFMGVLSLRTPFMQRPGWHLALGTLLLAAPWSATTVATLVRLGPPATPGVGLRARHLLVSASLAVLAVMLALKGIAFLAHSDHLMALTQATLPMGGLLLFAGAAPPAWLRAILRQHDEDVLRGRAGALFVYAGDQADLAERALRQAIAVVGASGGLLLDDRDQVLASVGFDASGTADLLRRVGQRDGDVLTIAVPLARGSGRFVLAAGPLVPVVGADEVDRVRELGLLVGVALDRFATNARRRRERDEYDAVLGAMDTIGLGVVRLRDWRVTFANGSAAEILDLPVTALYDVADIRNLLPDEPARELTDFAVASAGSAPSVRLTVDLGDATARRSVQVTVVRMGHPDDLALLMQDVTEHLRARDQLAESARRLHDAQTLARVGSFTYDAATGRITWGPGVAQILGLPSGAVTWSTVGDLPRVHRDDLDQVLARARRALVTGRGWRGTYRVVRAGGEVRRVDTRVRVVTADDGTVTGLEGACVDVTELHQLTEELRDSEARLRQLFVDLDRARELERRRIALELHDDLGQSLTGLQLRLAAIPVSDDHPDKRMARLLVADLQAKVRGLALRLRPGVLDRLGLGAALRWYAEHVGETLDLDVIVELGVADGVRLDREVETQAYRIVQEALSNVRRHAGTNRAWVSVRLADQTLHVQVIDRGVGFDPSTVAGGTGLTGIEERAAAVGGSARVRSRPGEGTTLSITMPTGDVTHDLVGLDEATPEAGGRRDGRPLLERDDSTGQRESGHDHRVGRR